MPMHPDGAAMDNSPNPVPEGGCEDILRSNQVNIAVIAVREAGRAVRRSWWNTTSVPSTARSTAIGSRISPVAMSLRSGKSTFCRISGQNAEAPPFEGVGRDGFP
jgi:hypothetical protein